MLIHYPCDWSASDDDPKNPSERFEIYKVLEEYKGFYKL